MRIEMDVRIDEARQKREAAQVAGCGDRFAAAHVRDRAVGNDDTDVRNRAAFAVEGRSGAKRDASGLGGGIDGRERDNDERAKNSHGGEYSRETCAEKLARRGTTERTEWILAHREHWKTFVRVFRGSSAIPCSPWWSSYTHVSGGHLMNAQRVIADLRELAARTSTPDGAQRLAWGPVWRDARAWFKAKIDQLGLPIRTDSAGNNWVTVPGASPKTVIVGSHLDSVPNGGWLDGCLGVIAGLEALRMHGGTMPPVTLKLVDWADEEGARFRRSLLGSAAAAGSLEIDDVRELKDRQGARLAHAPAH